jgi:multimeric flavodoxin WrbA
MKAKGDYSMKKALGLISSPREKGNSEIMTKEIMLHIGGDNQFEILRLMDLHIEPCKGCYSCMKPQKKCPRDDDLGFLLQKIAEADGVILSSPVYHWGMNIGVGKILDRAFLFKHWAKTFAKKPCVTFVTYGLPYEEGYALSALNGFVRQLNLLLKESAAFLGGSPGEVLRYGGNLERAKQLGEALFDASYQRKRNRFECPNCFGNMIKFRSAMDFPSPDIRPIRQVECAFCGTSVEIGISEKEMEMDYIGKGLYDERFPERLAEWHEATIRSFIKDRKEIENRLKKYDTLDVKMLRGAGAT